MRGKETITYEEFLSRARKAHGDKYDYSLVHIISSEDKIKIICPVHGVFEQHYGSHTSGGNGCPVCSGNKRLTKEEFIKRSQKVHGMGIYGYDLVDIKNARKKVKIICFKEKHGVFEQAPYAHLDGQGCPLCSWDSVKVNNRLSREEFIAKSKEVHGENTYDYSLVEYVDNHTKVKLICPKPGHGIFEQLPHNNSWGAGCPVCSGNKKLNKEEFVRMSRKRHGNKYDYSKFIYTNYNTASIIVCPDHGIFYQDPAHHCGAGNGCPSCGIITIGNKKRSNTEDFIEKAKKIHGHKKYNYSKVKYVDAVNTKVLITCEICKRDFWQVPMSHLLGNGCPHCNSSKGELFIEKWLDDNKMEYIREYELPGLKRLKFDFYMPILNMLVEFDGEQHYLPVCFGGISKERAIEQFKLTQKNDSIKNKFCSDNGISLLRIGYKDIKHIPEILSEKLLENDHTSLFAA